MFIEDYPSEELSVFWDKFGESKKSYTPNERWDEIVNENFRNKEFLSLTLDDVLYCGYYEKYQEKEKEATEVCPFLYMSLIAILARKTIIDYNVEKVIPSYEFDTYFQTRRIASLFENCRVMSEMIEKFSTYEQKMLELFPEESTTLWDIVNNEEQGKIFDGICENEDFSFEFLDLFTNMLTFDFVRNYWGFNNERNLDNIFDDDFDNSIEGVEYSDDNFDGYDA